MKGGLPRGTFEDPLTEGTLGVTGKPSTEHVEHVVDPPGFGMDNTGTDSKGD